MDEEGDVIMFLGIGGRVDERMMKEMDLWTCGYFPILA